jgi:hypothetical protein
MRLIHPSALLRAKVILFLRYDGFLAGRPPNTFLKGMEKVLEGLVKKWTITIACGKRTS